MQLMMKNKGYFVGFLAAFAAFIAEIVKFREVVGLWYEEPVVTAIVVLGPHVIMGLITYKGFYQHWKDYQNGTSR